MKVEMRSKILRNDIPLHLLTVTMTFFILLHSFSFTSYANSFMNQTVNIAGGGEMEWSEAEQYIKERLYRVETDDKYFFGYRTAQYIQNLIETKVTRTYSTQTAEDENVYLVFVCTTYNQPYNVYLHYANEFKEDYTAHGLDFTVLSQKDYENSRGIMKTMTRNQSNPNGMVLVADSGFSVTKNGLPFYNLAVTGKDIKLCIDIGGLCEGISYLTMMAYIDSDLLAEENFDKSMVNNFLKDYDGSSSLGITDIHMILDKNASAYQPDTEALQSLVYQKGKEEYGSRIVDIDTIKDTYDYDLIKTLAFYWYYFNNERVLNYMELKQQDVLDISRSCPSSELDLVIEELKAGRPVAVTVDDFEGGHSVVGYRLWQDMKNPKLYYMDVYDSNFPMSSEPQIIIYKGDYDGDKESYYFYYAPEKLEGDEEKVNTDYLFTYYMHFSDYKGRLLHKNNTVEHWNED